MTQLIDYEFKLSRIKENSKNSKVFINQEVDQLQKSSNFNINEEPSNLCYSSQDKIVDLMCISEGLIIKILKTYESNIKQLTNTTLIDAVEGLEYLEENDQIFADRLKAIHNEFSRHSSPKHLSPENTKEFFNSVVLQNSRILSTNLGNQKMMLSLIAASPLGSFELNYQDKEGSLQYQEKLPGSQANEMSYSPKNADDANFGDQDDEYLAKEAFSHMFYNY